MAPSEYANQKIRIEMVHVNGFKVNFIFRKIKDYTPPIQALG